LMPGPSVLLTFMPMLKIPNFLWRCTNGLFTQLRALVGVHWLALQLDTIVLRAPQCQSAQCSSVVNSVQCTDLVSPCTHEYTSSERSESAALSRGIWHIALTLGPPRPPRPTSTDSSHSRRRYGRCLLAR
jgi:hypothetical protein